MPLKDHDPSNDGLPLKLLSDGLRPEQAHDFLQLILRHIPDVVFVKDEDFKIVQANENFLNVYPESVRASVIGSTTLEHYDEEELQEFLQMDKIAFEQGVSETEESIQFPDGRRRVLFTKKVRFTDEKGDKFVLGIGRDITELVKVRRENELSLALLNTVFDTVSGAIIGLDADKKVLMINGAGRQMLPGNLPEPRFAWPDTIEFLDPADMHPLESSHDPIARAVIGHNVGGEVHLMTQRGTPDSRYVRVTSTSVETPDSPLRTVIVLDDVSEAERNRQHIERQSRLDALGQLTGGIAHDFNNLLNTMQFSLELIRRESLSERGERSAAAALNSIARGTDLTNRLLAFAKKQPSRSAAHLVGDVFKEMKDLIAPAIEASLTVAFEEPDDGLMVFCDQAQLQNAILNLVLNSRDAIMQHGDGNVVRVSSRVIDELPAEHLSTLQEHGGTEVFAETRAESGQGYVEISVSDNGPGMSKAIASRALDPFFTTKGVNSGTGLGLSMVYGFVQQSNGQLRIYTEEGEGTAIKLYLPRGANSAIADTDKEAAPLMDGKWETVLVVEDEDHLLEQFAELLKELKYTVLHAPTGVSALTMLKEGARPDLIITDVVMPGGMGGFELAKQARALLPEIPIIYMSGYTGFTNEEMGDVVAPLLTKPSSPSITSSLIRKVLDGE